MYRGFRSRELVIVEATTLARFLDCSCNVNYGLYLQHYPSTKLTRLRVLRFKVEAE